MHFHDRTARLNEDQMCIAVNTTWSNTSIIDADITGAASSSGPVDYHPSPHRYYPHRLHQ